MTTRFYIVLNVKTSSGPESFGRFFIGNNRERAYEVFKQMQGTEVDEKNVLYLDFMETVDGLPVNLTMITCTLNQLAENCKILTKEVFKLFNLERNENLL
ncbi:MAG TPA: hypothetical protein VFZ47_09150 [Chitinophagaceae bacterium]